MEEKEPKSVLKTPRRTRRTSVLESQQSPPVLTEIIGENNVESLTKLDPVTPGRSTRPLDYRTPSRSEALSAIQTPRRSCRKSIKPIQEYENIVAQKGLSVKRLITEQTTSEEVEEEATSQTTSELRENKWTAADIGRVSSKRSKKKRNKAKRLARQKNIVVEEDAKMEVEEIGKADEDLAHNDLDHDENKRDDIDVEKEEPKVDENPVPMETEAEEEGEKNEDEDAEISPADEVAPEIQIEKNIPPADSEDSLDGGDVILNAMPVTGDDCMPSPEKPLQDSRNSISASPVAESANLITEPANPVVESANPVSESTASAADSTNKSDDSDCIMLSLNESSQSRQSYGLKSSSFAAESKSQVNISSDSFGASMPPLLVCSDDEDDEPEFVDALRSPNGGEHFELAMEEEHCEGTNDPDPLNGTFTSKERNLDEEEGELIASEMCPQEKEPKLIDDTILSPKEIRKIVLGIEEIPDDPKEPQASSPNDETFDADQSPIKTPHTESSITRILTPFKSDKQILPDIFIEPEEELEETPKFIYESKENKLKSSRKRSFSFCVDRPKKNVTFHSPSNTTININREDMTKIATKHTPINITKRRKRSLSVTETERDLLDYIQMKKPSQDGTPKKKLAHQSKIKMPNFSNIHQKQFQRMESITDHVARRAERAKVLINSSSKIRPASVQKGLPPKNVVLRDHNKDAANKTLLPMPKARHRIDMSQVENKTKADIENNHQIGAKFRTKSKQDLRPLDDLQMVGKTPTKATSANSTSLFKQNNANKLPKQKFNFNFNSTTVPTCGNTTVTSVPQRVHLPNPRENFNLSTVITSTKQPPKGGDKLEDRRKRMMEMFKSKSSQRAATSKKEILKGVRTNRRFELQMLCRNRQN